MTKRLLVFFLCLLALASSALAAVRRENTREDKAATKPDVKRAGLGSALLDEVQTWADSADFWRLLTRGEALAARIEVRAVKSNVLEAWVCGAAKICLSTRLLRDFTPEAQQAVVAHELGHLLIPRNYDAHPQLWEAQCDLFAVALLRDAEQVKGMLGVLADDCATCQDSEHPTPGARAALVEQYATAALTKALKFDEFRVRSYAIQFKAKPNHAPAELQHLSFAVRIATAQLAELRLPRVAVQPLP